MLRKGKAIRGRGTSHNEKTRHFRENQIGTLFAEYLDIGISSKIM